MRAAARQSPVPAAAGLTNIPPSQLFREQTGLKLCLKLSSVRDKLATKTIQKLVYCVNNI